MTRVLASHEIRSSKRSQDFRRFVVENTLQGAADISKSEPLASKLWAPYQLRPERRRHRAREGWRSAQTAGALLFPQGAANPLRIELPSGTYVPEFPTMEARAEQPHVEMPPVAAATGNEPHRPNPWRTRALWAALGAAMGFAYWAMTPPVTTLVDQFWAPVLQVPRPSW
jgi:hypothetical protein